MIILVKILDKSWTNINRLIAIEIMVSLPKYPSESIIGALSSQLKHSTAIVVNSRKLPGSRSCPSTEAIGTSSEME